MFPSLVNCCTIDWFLPWPTEALLSVAKESFLKTVPDPELGEKLSLTCVTMHEVSFSAFKYAKFKKIAAEKI